LLRIGSDVVPLQGEAMEISMNPVFWTGVAILVMGVAWFGLTWLFARGPRGYKGTPDAGDAASSLIGLALLLMGLVVAALGAFAV